MGFNTMMDDGYRGTASIKFKTPVDPINIRPYEYLPYGALVTSVEINYVPKGYAEKLKRHDAAVKANATRKAKKEGGAK